MAHSLYELIVHVWKSKINESFYHLYGHSKGRFQVIFTLFLNKKVPDILRKWKTGSPEICLTFDFVSLCVRMQSVVLPILSVTSPSTTKEMERWPNEIGF